MGIMAGRRQRNLMETKILGAIEPHAVHPHSDDVQPAPAAASEEKPLEAAPQAEPEQKAKSQKSQRKGA
jgi:hypothetical protein